MTSLPKYLWHGTSDVRLREILEAGALEPNHATLTRKKLCLTSRRDVALHFASEKCREDRHRGDSSALVFLCVPSASLDPAHLLPDPVMMAEAQRPQAVGPEISPYSREFMRLMILTKRNETASWQSSFETCGCVRYSTRIPITPAMVDVSVTSIPPLHIPRENDLAPAEPVFVENPLDHALAIMIENHANWRAL